MKKAKLKLIQASVILEIEGNPVPARFKDIHIMLREVSVKNIELTNPEILPEYFAQEYRKIQSLRGK
ncbi:MAG: hypothetical protein WC760_06310 [Bacteroidia bacterium]|jgi:hypothetical protein